MFGCKIIRLNSSFTLLLLFKCYVLKRVVERVIKVNTTQGICEKSFNIAIAQKQTYGMRQNADAGTHRDM